MDTLVVEPARRERRHHSEEFKRQVIEACMQPGVSVAAIALANGLNANYLRRWVKAHREASRQTKPSGEMLNRPASAMVPVSVVASPAPSAPAPEIRLDLHRGGTTLQLAWPLEAAASLGSCLRELLR